MMMMMTMSLCEKMWLGVCWVGCVDVDRDDEMMMMNMVVYMSVYIHMYIYRSESVWMHGTHPMWRPE